MIPSQPIIRLARITLEATAPLSLASGRNDGIFDTHLVRDANGLPAIPGTALAGILRHLAIDRLGQFTTDRLFGYIRKGKDEGHASRVSVTHGHIHDTDNRPVDSLSMELSPFLEPLANSLPPKRDHVRLNRLGSVDGDGKFDRAYLTAGHRFTFDLILQSEEADDDAWHTLLSALSSAAFRLGGATRRGYGGVKVLECRGVSADLRSTEGHATLAAWPARLDAALPASAETLSVPEAADDTLIIGLNLTPEAGFRIGHPGAPPLSNDSKPADAVPYTEQRVSWVAGKAVPVERQIVVPASSVKGALRHRTAFHHARLTGQFISRTARLDELPAEDGLDPLFGNAKDSRETTGEKGLAGCIWLDDAVLELGDYRVSTQTHVSIDRFTGGARQGRLFKEELARAAKPDVVTFKLALDRKRLDVVSAMMRRAFRLALEDLAQGRLALGAASTRGHGYFTGRIEGDLVQLETEHD